MKVLKSIAAILAGFIGGKLKGLREKGGKV